jgi:hypothetical protein
MADLCSAPDCQNAAPFGTLCAACETVWLSARSEVVDEADHWTFLSASFVAWCAANGQPNPYTD